MITVKPISPQQARELKVTVIPPEVIQAFNELILENLSPGRGKMRSVIRQDDVVERICTKMTDIEPSAVYKNKWLDVEPIFEGQGWKVEYDKPAYNESYPATFTFTEK